MGTVDDPRMVNVAGGRDRGHGRGCLWGLGVALGLGLGLGLSGCTGADGESEASTDASGTTSMSASSGSQGDSEATTEATESGGETSTSPVCGDGTVDPGEACDDGPDNGDDRSCTSTCEVNVCGDGLVGPDESCDDPDPDLCTPECLAVVFNDPVEADDGAWEHALIDDPGCEGNYCAEDLWSVEPIPLETGETIDPGSQRAWSSGDLSSVRGPSSTRLWTTIDLSAATAPITLYFDHHYALKAELPEVIGADGAIVEVAVDGGPFENQAVPVYNGTVGSRNACPQESLNPLLGEDAFVGGSGKWLRDSVSLDPFAGSVIEVGFRVGVDCASSLAPFNAPVIWHLDNVRVTASLVGDD